MPSYADFVRDYWAPDRDAVLAELRRQGEPASDAVPIDIPGVPMPEWGNRAPGWPVPGAGGWSPGQFPTDLNGVPQIPGVNVPETGRIGSAPPGFEATKWANPAHQSAKYRAGRALAGGATIEQVAQMLGGEAFGPDRLAWTNPETGQREVIDAIFDVEGVRRPQWIVEGPGTGGGEGAGAGEGAVAGQGAAAGSDWFGANAPGGATGTAGGAAGGTGSLLAPWTVPFAYPEFQAPTGEEVFSDPGVRFRMSEANKALQRNASARGTLNTGGTLRAIMGLNQDLASQEYGNLYNRRRSEWDTRYNKARGEYGLGYDIYAANQDRPFNKLFAVAGLGQGAGSQLGALGAQYANLYGNTAMRGAGAQGDYWTQAANARAAGQVGRANAWNPVYNLPWMWGA